MRQILHLLVVEPTQRVAFVETFGRRWMLPVIACAERDRAPLVAARWLADRQLHGVIAGQWLGRIGADGRSIDWLIAIDVSGRPEASLSGWAPLDCLESANAVLDYQSWALRIAVTPDAIGVAGPFGSIDWIPRARAWIESCGFRHRSNPKTFRASANEVVLGLRSGRADVYFKGAAADRAPDLHAMAQVAQPWRDSFPRTLALEERRDSTLCLLERCAGVPLAGFRDHDAAVRIASDIGRLQQRVDLESLQSTLNLPDVREAADRLLEAAGLPSCSTATRRAFDDVMALPQGWTPMDLDPGNVFVDGRRIRYIDLEPRITAMPMSLSIFARRLSATGELLQALRRAYESTFGQAVPWAPVDHVSELTEVVTGWQRVLRNVERGEVSGPLDHVARAAAKRLVSAKPLV